MKHNMKVCYKKNLVYSNKTVHSRIFLIHNEMMSLVPIHLLTEVKVKIFSNLLVGREIKIIFAGRFLYSSSSKFHA